jgi:hypothetical protein
MTDIQIDSGLDRLIAEIGSAEEEKKKKAVFDDPQVRTAIGVLAAHEIARLQRIRIPGNHCWFCGVEGVVLTHYEGPFAKLFNAEHHDHRACSADVFGMTRTGKFLDALFRSQVALRSNSVRSSAFRILCQAARQIEPAEDLNDETDSVRESRLSFWLSQADEFGNPNEFKATICRAFRLTVVNFQALAAAISKLEVDRAIRRAARKFVKLQMFVRACGSAGVAEKEAVKLFESSESAVQRRKATRRR